MAIWQVRLDFLPENILRDKYGAVRTVFSEAEIEWWSHAQPTTGCEAWLSEVLPQAEPWGKETRLGG